MLVTSLISLMIAPAVVANFSEAEVFTMSSMSRMECTLFVAKVVRNGGTLCINA